MKLVDIMNMSGSDLNKLTTSELKSVYRTLNRNVNARVTRLVKSGLTGVSPAIRYGRETGVIGTSKKPSQMTHKQLRKEISQQRNFLSKKTSTVTGSKKYYKNITGKKWGKTTETQTGGEININEFFKVYENMKREFASELASGILTSEQIMVEIRRVWNQEDGFVNWKKWDQQTYNEIFSKLYGYAPTDIDAMIDDIMDEI